MPTEDLQHTGKCHQEDAVDRHAAQITEATEELFDQGSKKVSTEEAGKWKSINRAAMGQDQPSSTNNNVPWHALAAVKKDKASEKHAG
jgi:hypothetical protein